MSCRGCGSENRPGRKFCGQCGAPLERVCQACGAANDPADRFCGGCGAALVEGVTSAAAPAGVQQVSERRLVSVLFADLVGFTTMSEHRDPEEIRNLLSQYFDRCRTLIERYGGTVEKFIGDAVMAVWGSPVAREDDAERAVRAALTLTRAVSVLAEELHLPELRVRAGVLTGNAAVELGAESEGMVLGDTVNTASRLQSIAEPGTVLVDDVTHRASEAAVAYEDAGVHQVKGREQPVHAWRALRVVAGAGGARRGAGVEAPFVGRDLELQTIVDTGEVSARERQARLVAVVGEAGAGKSRLVWEFFKYLDGIEETRWWHQGRCLAYGEGVGYWALAEMVRSRAGILEDDSPAMAREKLHASVVEHVPEEREQRLVEPRLAHLLRLEERPEADRADLFSGWRLFFERMALSHPAILVFEDLQWAEAGLLDFIDYVLDWSAEYPIFILALGRPQLLERRPAWEPLALHPLTPEAIASMLEGLAPGLPEDVVGQIQRRADGIPLYAVETIRMLRDRGILVQHEASYVVTSEITDLDVPETLQALVASRLDGLSSGERSLLQDASVLGHSFTAAGAAAVSGVAEGEVIALLDGLVLKQVLGRDDDPRSPERGQYVFLQALLRTVAYGTLSRRARKVRHVAAVRHLRQTWPGEARDIAEVLAAHYQEAIRAEPDADDVRELRAAARETLTAAGRATASLGLGPEAQRYFEQAADHAENDVERAGLYEAAGLALYRGGDAAGAEERLRRAIATHEQIGSTGGASAAVVLASLLRYRGDMDEARALLEAVGALPESDVDKIVRAEALAELGAMFAWQGSPELAGPPLEEALTILELEQAWPSLANALVHRSVHLIYSSRREEGIGVLERALALAEVHDLPSVALRARLNLSQISIEADRYIEASDLIDEAMIAARERGDRLWERQLMSQALIPHLSLGRWSELEAAANTVRGDVVDLDTVAAAYVLGSVAAARGDEETMASCVRLVEDRRDSSYLDQQLAARATIARDLSERGSLREALALCRSLLSLEGTSGEFLKESYTLGLEAAIALGDIAEMEYLEGFVDALPPVRATPVFRAGRDRLAAERLHLEGDAEASERYEDEAIALLRSLEVRPMLGRALSERAHRRDDPQALAEARAIFTELGATRWLEHLETPTSLGAPVAESSPAAARP